MAVFVVDYLRHRECLTRVAGSSDIYRCVAVLTRNFNDVRRQRGAVNTTQVLCTWVRRQTVNQSIRHQRSQYSSLYTVSRFTLAPLELRQKLKLKLKLIIFWYWNVAAVMHYISCVLLNIELWSIFSCFDWLFRLNIYVLFVTNPALAAESNKPLLI